MALNPADIATVSRLLDEALALEPAEREAWLAALPPEHLRHAGALRDMLTQEAQLDADHRLEAMPKLAPDEAVAHAGDRVGAYRLLHEIGRGGMGSVWLAERADGAYKRQVALKLPRLAWGAGLAERMAREREIGMLLEHPAIARLYDAGLDDRGRPYLALEYIDGQPLDAWCEAQALDVRSRLRLFLQVVRAVAYAHGRLVVHRDLKPSNVLVSADGQAHLLDFGIAKLLGDAAQGEAGLTQQQGQVLTPNYAAPEQVAGQAITVACDVYSLGVLLYEVLTGSLPIAPKRNTLGAVEEAILQGDAPLASSRVKDRTLAKALRGEIDAILAKAMQREPGRRYATADALAQDIERHLNGETVAARPDSVMYRLRKSVRRHWVGFGATAAIGIAIVTGGATTLMESQRAARQAERARLATDFVSEMFRVNARTVAGAAADRSTTPAEFLDHTADLIRTRFEGQPDIQAQLYGAVAQVYADMGAGSQAVAFANRQLTLLRAADATSTEMARAVLLMARALDAQDLDAQAREQARLAVQLAHADKGLLAEAYALLARVLGNNGEFDASRVALLEAKRILESGPASPSTAWADVSTVQAMLEHDIAENLRLRQRSLVHALEAEGPASPYAVMVRSHMADILASTGRGAEARALIEDSWRAVRGTGGAGEVSAAWRAAKTWSHLYESGEASFAEASAAIDVLRTFAAGSAAVPPVLRAKIDFYAGRNRLAWGDLNGAGALLGPSARLLKEETNYLMLKIAIVSTEAELASLQGRHEAANLLLRESHTLELKTASFWNFHFTRMLEVAVNLNRMGRSTEAAELIAQTERNARGQKEQDSELLALLAETSARISLDSGDNDAASRAIQDADEINAAQPAERSEQRMILRGEALCVRGQAVAGFPMLQQALQSMGSKLSHSDPAFARARAVAGLCALALGRRVIAADYAAQAHAAFAAQPEVSPYFKAPLAKLERALGLRLPPV